MDLPKAIDAAGFEAMMRCVWHVTDVGTLTPIRDFMHPSHLTVAPKLLLISEGRITYWLDNATYRMPRGTVMYRPSMTRAHWRVESHLRCRLDFIEFAPQDAEHEVRTPLVATMASPAAETEHYQHAAAVYHDRSPTGPLELECLAKLALIRLWRRATRAVQGRRRPGPRLAPGAAAAVRKAIAYVAQEFANPDVMTDLAKHSGLSEDYFRLAFKRATGITAQQFLLRTRMRAAKMYLTSGDIPVKQVAQAVGYRDPLYFSRVYARFYHQPPRTAMPTRPDTA